MSKLSDARRSRRSRLAIVLAYAAIGIGWIATSDAIVNSLPDGLAEPIATFKGALFVVISSGLLWIVMLARDARVERERTALAASEERHRLLAEHQRDVVYRLRVFPVAGFEYVSPSIKDITGHTPEEHYADPELGRNLIDPEDLPLLARAAGAEGPVLIRWRNKDGGTIYTEHRSRPCATPRAISSRSRAWRVTSPPGSLPTSSAGSSRAPSMPPRSAWPCSHGATTPSSSPT